MVALLSLLKWSMMAQEVPKTSKIHKVSPNIVIQAPATAGEGETLLLARPSAIHTERLITHAGVGDG